MIRSLSAAAAAPGPLQLDMHEFERALSGEDWPDRLVAHPLFWATILVAVGAAAVSAIVLYRIRRDRAHMRPTWRRLAARLSLSRQQRRQLEQLGTAAGLVNPVPLVISRGCFDFAAQRMHRSKSPLTLQSLRAALFD